METNVSIIVACIPTMKPLYVALTGKASPKQQCHGFTADDLEARRHGSRSAHANVFPLAAKDLRHDLEPPYAMTTYASSSQKRGTKEDSGSEEELVSDAAMPGTT